MADAEIGVERYAGTAGQDHRVLLRDEDFAAVGERPPAIGSLAHTERRAARSRRADAKIWRLAMFERKPSSARLDAIGQGLEDRSIAVRRATAGLLARFGTTPQVPIAAVHLHSDRRRWWRRRSAPWVASAPAGRNNCFASTSNRFTSGHSSILTP